MFRYECYREADGSSSTVKANGKTYKRVKRSEFRINHLLQKKIDEAKFHGIKYRLYQLIDERINRGMGYKIVRVDFSTGREENPIYFMQRK